MNNLKKFFASLALVVMMFATLPGFVLTTSAQANSVNPCDGGAAKPVGCDNWITRLFPTSQSGVGGIKALIQTIGNLAVTILASISVLYLLLSAYKMISDSGDGKGWKDGLAGVKYAILGLVVALLAFGIVSFIVGFVK